MPHRNQIFKFTGFEPTHEVRGIAKSIINRIIDNSPAHSARKALLSKNNDDFRAEIKISSEAGVFEATVDGPQPEAVLDQVFTQIDAQLADWKLKRHTIS